MNAVVDTRIDAYRPFDKSDELMVFYHRRGGYSPKRSVNMRRNVAKARLRRIAWLKSQHPLFGDEYQTEYQSEEARLNALVEHLSNGK